jgi:hypothetical protein
MECAGTRESTSRNHANGSTPHRLQEAMKLRKTAAVLPPLSLPKKVQFPRGPNLSLGDALFPERIIQELAGSENSRFGSDVIKRRTQAALTEAPCQEVLPCNQQSQCEQAFSEGYGLGQENGRQRGTKRDRRHQIERVHLGERSFPG